MVTDYDCWHTERGVVGVTDILAVVDSNTEQARALVSGLPTRLVGRPSPCPDGCTTALDGALITPPEARDPELLAKLDAVAGRVLRGS